MNITIESEKNSTATDVPQPKAKRVAAKKAKPAKVGGPRSQANRKPNAPTRRPR